ncbi:MAG: helix-hairpin-helix domain-containing protein [Bdellovibrionota bacterium]
MGKTIKLGSKNLKLLISTKKATLASKMLMQIPTIGFVKSQILLNHFGTLDKILAATRSELLEIPGIGPSRADLILNINS